MSPVTFTRAKREGVPLLIGLAGGTGSGKTYSAMRLAKGLAGEKPFAVIDTENGRAKHYADAFEFDHAELHAPFRPAAYAQAIEEAAKQGYGVIAVDSMSHEWDGDGGMLDWQEEEFQRLGGRDAVKMTSWIKPKMAHRKFVTRLLQVPAHVILCFRAAEKVDMVRDSDGKMKVIPKQTLIGADGWVPITEKNLPYELTLSCLLLASAPGLPKPIKLQEQHRPMLPLDQPISEQTGEALAKWAAGSTTASARKSEGEAKKLTTELLEVADSMGKKDEVAAAIARHRSGHSTQPAQHVTWLRAQIKRAREASRALAGVGAEESE